MKETLNFKNINLNEDFRDVVKKDLNSKIRESASIPKLGKVQIGKGYKRPFAENNRLTEMKVRDNFSFRDSYLESLDLNDGGKSTSARLKEAEDTYNRRRIRPIRPTVMNKRTPVVNHRIRPDESNGPSMQDALDAYLASNKDNTLTEAKKSVRNSFSEGRTVKVKGMSMKDSLDAYLAKRDSLEEKINKRSFKEKSSTSSINDMLFFVVKTPNGKYLCKDEKNKLIESRSFEIAEAYESFDEAESAVRSYAERMYENKVSDFEIRGIEESDFREKVESPKKRALNEKNKPVKDITVDFPVSVSAKGHIKASDAKRLLKYLYSSKQLRAGTQYFIKDMNGEETSWDFDKSIFDNGYQYCFSCEVWDDDKDVYQALFISKDYKGRLDWSDTEWTRESVK